VYLRVTTPDSDYQTLALVDTGNTSNHDVVDERVAQLLYPNRPFASTKANILVPGSKGSLQVLGMIKGTLDFVDADHSIKVKLIVVRQLGSSLILSAQTIATIPIILDLVRQ
jgi:hypothetical protein